MICIKSNHIYFAQININNDTYTRYIEKDSKAQQEALKTALNNAIKK